MKEEQVKKITEKLEKEYPGKNIVYNKDEKGEVKEVICEHKPGVAKSTAIAVIENMPLSHYHPKVTETYKVYDGGSLKVTLFNRGNNNALPFSINLNKGESYVISPNFLHQAESCNADNPAWIKVKSVPGWTFEGTIPEKMPTFKNKL